MALDLRKIARGGRNTRWHSRGSNRPRGEGRGFVDTLKALLRIR